MFSNQEVKKSRPEETRYVGISTTKRFLSGREDFTTTYPDVNRTIES
jgi:hypothetical protein